VNKPCGQLYAAGRQLNHFLHHLLSALLLISVDVVERLKFLRVGFLRHRPRLNFTGAEQRVEDGAERVHGASEIEHQSPRGNRLLQRKSTHVGGVAYSPGALVKNGKKCYKADFFSE